MQPTILFIHQSSELYGSDKTLLILAKIMKEKKFRPIVVLPDTGLLSAEFDKKNIEYIIAPVIKISRTMFSVKNLITLPFQIRKSIKIIENSLVNTKIDIVYSNTLAVLLGLFYTRKHKIKHIWHVHEIIENPKIVRKIFTRLLSLKINSKIIFNSNSTKKVWIQKNKNLPYSVVWNGLDKPHFEKTENPSISDQLKSIKIGLVGRINKWKGQHLLLQAFKELEPLYDIELFFIGSPPPNQEIWLLDLEAEIKNSKLNHAVKIISFQTNIWEIWEQLDIAVIPSTLPEPFGLVALEAMLCEKPVIAANHGGLAEIVVDNETGYLFEPSNVFDLKSKLEDLIMHERKRNSFGLNGLERAKTFFTEEIYVNNIIEICNDLLKENNENSNTRNERNS